MSCPTFSSLSPTHPPPRQAYHGGLQHVRDPRDRAQRVGQVRGRWGQVRGRGLGSAPMFHRPACDVLQEEEEEEEEEAAMLAAGP